MIELRVLGSLDLKGPEGETLLSVLAQHKRVALLAYLAVASPNGFHRRDKLVGLFWAESDQEHGRAALRKALYILRQSLGDDVVVNRGDEEVGLAAGSVWCDAPVFGQALEGGELEKAVELYAGPLLDGFHLGGADEFERWLEGERRRLAARYAEALENLAGRAEAAGQFVSAVGWWQRLAAVDPYNTRVAIRLMEALAAAGDRGNALQYAEQHEHRLREELGIEPDEELRALVERLRREPAASGQVTGAGLVREGRSAVADARPVEDVLVESRRVLPGQVPLSRALATYALVSLGVLTAVHIFTLQLGLPAWFFQSAVILLFACLPVVVVTALVAGKPAGKSWVSWRNAFGVIALAFVLLGATVSGYMAMRAMGIGPWGTLIGNGELEERDVIVLADFADHTGDPTLALTVTEAFRVDLGQSPVVRVAERDYVSVVLERMERNPNAEFTHDLAREVAIREGLKAVVAGAINKASSSYVLSARLVAAETGEELHAARETAEDLDAIIPAVDRLSLGLRDRIGESLKTVRGSLPLSRVRTASLEALRLYTEAQLAGARGDGNRAVGLLNQAIEIDTAFAAAYRSRAGGFEGRAQRIADVKKAYELRDRLPLIERYMNEAAFHRVVTGDFEKAIGAYLTVLELRPDDSAVLNALGATYRRVGDFARAEEMFRRRIESDSLAVTSWLNLAVTQFNRGRIDEAEETLQRVEKMAPESAPFSFTRARFASALGDYEAAEAHIRARGRQRSSIARRGATSRDLALLAQVQGKVAEAENHFRDWMAACEELDRANGCTHIAIEHASMQVWLLGDTARALRTVATALERYPLDSIQLPDRNYDVLAGFYAYAGRPERAREILAEWEAVEPDVSPTRGTSSHVYWGAVALAEGRAEEALAEFRLGQQRDPDPCTTCYLPQLARAYELAGQPDSAIALYERYVRTPYDGRLLGGTAPTGGRDAFWLPVAYERLGDLYEQCGDTANAMLYQAKLVELWKDADFELQPRVEAARRAIRALTADR